MGDLLLNVHYNTNTRRYELTDNYANYGGKVGDLRAFGTLSNGIFSGKINFNDNIEYDFTTKKVIYQSQESTSKYLDKIIGEYVGTEGTIKVYKDEYGRYVELYEGTNPSGSLLSYIYYDTSTNIYKSIAKKWINKPEGYYLNDTFCTLQGNTFSCYEGYYGSNNTIKYTKITEGIITPTKAVTSDIVRIQAKELIKTIAVGSQDQAVAGIYSSDGKDIKLRANEIKWSSSDNSILRIESQTTSNDNVAAIANIRGLKAGKVKLRATLPGGRYDECEVTVVATGASVASDIVRIQAKEQIKTIAVGSRDQATAGIYSSDGKNIKLRANEIVWSSSDNSILQIVSHTTSSDNMAAIANIRGVKAGKVKLRATLPGGRYDECEITVYDSKAKQTSSNNNNILKQAKYLVTSKEFQALKRVDSFPKIMVKELEKDSDFTGLSAYYQALNASIPKLLFEGPKNYYELVLISMLRDSQFLSTLESIGEDWVSDFNTKFASKIEDQVKNALEGTLDSQLWSNSAEKAIDAINDELEIGYVDRILIPGKAVFAAMNEIRTTYALSKVYDNVILVLKDIKTQAKGNSNLINAIDKVIDTINKSKESTILNYLATGTRVVWSALKEVLMEVADRTITIIFNILGIVLEAPLGPAAKAVDAVKLITNALFAADGLSDKFLILKAFVIIEDYLTQAMNKNDIDVMNNNVIKAQLLLAEAKFYKSFELYGLDVLDEFCKDATKDAFIAKIQNFPDVVLNVLTGGKHKTRYQDIRESIITKKESITSIIDFLLIRD